MSKFYKHYKDKPYKYHGIVKHSESLEDLVLYETLYKNELGKMWVRPKDMFFSKIESNGLLIDRFQNVNPDLQITESLKSEEIDGIVDLAKKVFTEFDESKFFKKIEKTTKNTFVRCFVEKSLVGFKLGYQADDRVYYSWLGGVSPEFRGLGFGKDMMNLQHDWCKQHGYKSITTKTKNSFREMLYLNLSSGFQITDVLKKDGSEPKILMEKFL